MDFFQQFGGSVTEELAAQYSQSPNWRDGSFQNLAPTDLNIAFSRMPGIIYKQLMNRKAQMPSQPLPVQPFDRAAFLAPSERAKLIWYGHAVVLMRLQGQTILIDPMFGDDTTPIAPIPTKRFSERPLELIDDLPDIDVILITHDHYDHLDLNSIRRIRPKVKQYFVAMGVKRHLVRWGVAADIIHEMDWWQTKSLNGVKITFTPTQHFSGRGLTDRLKTLWGGWVLKTDRENLYFSGDGGYNTHFKTIGERLGPFDFGIMECGQYNDDWRPVHLFPDEAVQAAQDAQVKKAMPFHWGSFALSYQHAWHEPPTEFVQSAQAKGLDYSLPLLGQLFTVSDDLTECWWEG